MHNQYRVNQYYVEAYNARRGVENAEAIYAEWEVDSQKARQNHACQIATPYGKANRETIDLFFAENSKRWLVFIHGGYWRVMTSQYFHFIATPFLEAGWNVAFPEYDLCPAVTIHTITDQCRRAIAWLNQTHQPDELVITGHSAGGHLTGMMFATDWTKYGLAPQTITGGIAISSLFDLDPIAQTKMNSDLKLSLDDVQQLSPARLLPQVDAPLVLAVGSIESDEFKRQNALLKGVPEWDAITSQPHILDNTHHFNILHDLMQQDGVMWSSLLAMR